jgi:hypothetical protein
LPDLTEITEKVVVGSRDALLFVAVPMLLAIGVFDLPATWAVVGAALMYGFHHLSTGPVAVSRAAAGGRRLPCTCCAATSRFPRSSSSRRPGPGVRLAAATGRAAAGRGADGDRAAGTAALSGSKCR